MNTESQYEKMYNDLVAGLEKMHRKNVKRTSSALKSLLIIPTFFLIMLFMAHGSKTIFLVLWIASMFIIAGILIVIEYQDYLLRQMFTQVGSDEPQFEQPENPIPDEAASRDEALILAERIRQSVQQRSPEFDGRSYGVFEYDNPEETFEAEQEPGPEPQAAPVTDDKTVSDGSPAASDEEEAKV